MDDFLTKMYEEEMEKTSAAELDNFMESLSREELEGLLGIDKLAVGGPVEAPLPDSLPGNELDAQMRNAEQVAVKTQTETPPTRKQEAEPTAVSHQGPGKQPTTKEAMAWADVVGRMLAKTAAGEDPEYTVRPESWWQGQKAQQRAMRAGDKGLSKYLADNELIGKRVKGQLGGGLVGMGVGGGAGALGGLIASAASRGKIRPGEGAAMGGLLGGTGGGLLGSAIGAGRADIQHLKERGIQPTLLGLGRGRLTEEAAKKYLKKEVPYEKTSQGMEGEGGEMETTAAVKAKIAQRALRVIAGAPEHVKQAAAKVAGSCMAKQTAFTTPEAKVKAKLMSKAMKMGKGQPTSSRKGLISAMGKKL